MIFSLPFLVRAYFNMINFTQMKTLTLESAFHFWWSHHSHLCSSQSERKKGGRGIVQIHMNKKETRMNHKMWWLSLLVHVRISQIRDLAGERKRYIAGSQNKMQNYLFIFRRTEQHISLYPSRWWWKLRIYMNKFTDISRSIPIFEMWAGSGWKKERK